MSKFQYQLICEAGCKHAVRIGDMRCPQHKRPFRITVPTQKQKKWWEFWK